jgi:hypothetical protein
MTSSPPALPDTALHTLRDGFTTPTPASRPMMRWWWFGPAVERPEILRELDAMAAAGFGGAELSVVYPLAEESDRYLSPTFLADVRFAAEAARDRGLRFDLTLGSGWSFGGPHIDAATAARSLHWERLEVGPLASELPLPAAWPSDEFVAAYIGDGSLQEQPDSLELLTVSDGHIRIPAARGPRVVVTAVSRLTGQNVKRAAHGAEGPVFDHYSHAATRSHIDHVAEPLVTAVGAELLGSVFCDSLEVYGADWTPGAVAEFARLRGYDPLPELHLLDVATGAGADATRFRRDMYRTLTELYEQNFLIPLRQWAAAQGVPFRIQGYGEPPASVSSYRFADMFEGEGWGWKEVTQTRWASSAAHLYGKPVVSSEIWTWVHSPSFRATPLDLVGEAHEHLLLGINHFIGHGWPYSPGGSTPGGADGIGWMFYASGALDDRNPWWPAMPELTGYLHRLAWLMRQGEPVADVALYAPTSDAYAAMHSGGGPLIDLWRTTRELIGDAVPRAIRECGLDFDLIDDDALEITAPGRYPIVVLPNVEHLPDAALAWLAELESAGGTVISVGTDPRGTDLVALEGLAAVLRAAVSAPHLMPASPAVGITRRRSADADILFLANTAGEPQSFELVLPEPRAMVERWDPSTGDVTRRLFAADRIPLVLAAYEAAVLVVSDATGPSAGIAVPDSTARVALSGPWTVDFGDGPTSVELPHRWEETPGRAHYSGSANYSTTVDIPAPAAHAWLDFGPAAPLELDPDGPEGIRGRSFRAEVTTPLGEIAVVIVNGTRAGVVWTSPYVLDVGPQLVAGRNTIEIVVFNTAANALSADITVADWAAASEARWGRRFRMQDLQRAADGVSSGLLGVPSLALAD